MKKFGKLLLAGAIALGGVTAVDAVAPSAQHQVEADVVSYNVWAYSYSKNTVDHNFNFIVVNSIDHTGRTVFYYIKNSNGKIMQSGQSKFRVGFQEDYDVAYTTEAVHSNVSSLAPGTYEILYIYNVGSTAYRSTIDFVKASDGTITVLTYREP